MPSRFFASGKRLREVQGPGRNLLLRAKRYSLPRIGRKETATGEYDVLESCFPAGQGGRGKSSKSFSFRSVSESCGQFVAACVP